MDSELAVPAEIDGLSVIVTGTRGPMLMDYALDQGTLPATLGLVPESTATPPFSVELQAKRAGQTVATARATSVHFVAGERRMLALFLRRACIPACPDVVDPTLPPFDPNHIPRATVTDGGTDAPADGGSDGGTDAPIDSGGDGGTDAPADGGRDADAGGALDAAPDAPPDVGSGDGPPDATLDGPRDVGDTGPMCTAGFGGCSAACAAGTYCSAAGTCVPGFVGFCQVGGCTCAIGLTCQSVDGSAAGECR